jgi:hypothetical protein
MKERPKSGGGRDSTRRVLWGAVLGFIAANLLRGGPFALFGFVEVFKRLWSWVNGVGGESEQWGEPLYWLCVMGWPGAIAGAGIAVIREWMLHASRRGLNNKT